MPVVCPHQQREQGSHEGVTKAFDCLFRKPEPRITPIRMVKTLYELGCQFETIKARCIKGP